MEYISTCRQRNLYISKLEDSLEGNTLVLAQYIEKQLVPLCLLITERCEGRAIHLIYGATPTEDREKVRELVENENDALIGICVVTGEKNSEGKTLYFNNSLFVKKMEEQNIKLDWSICAFGKEEMSCLEKAVSLEGKIRVGFENSLFMPNGEIASDNHMKVDAINKLFKLSQ